MNGEAPSDLRGDPVLVLGMHHSGTSILTELLHRHGVFMHANMKHHESTLFTHQLDDALLMGGGSSWSRLPIMPVDEVLAKIEIARAFIEENVLAAYVRDGYDGVSRWGFKDPRACVLLPLYLELFPDAQLIHIVRDEHDVALSLAARRKEGLGVVEDLAFWKELRRQHVDRVRAVGGAHARYLEITYESFCTSPEVVGEELFAYLGLPVTLAARAFLRDRVHARSVSKASAVRAP